MSAFDEKMALYRQEMDGSGQVYDAQLLGLIAKGLGPSIYLADASQIACTDKSERDRIKENYLIKKLGCADGPELDEAILFVCDKMKGAKVKYRAVFYYWLVMHLGLETKYN